MPAIWGKVTSAALWMGATAGRVLNARKAGEGEAAAVEILARPAGLLWLEELKPVEGFPYTWPDKNVENYGPVWAGVIDLQGKRVKVEVGETERFQRGRLTVFLDHMAVVEFVDSVGGSCWASLIKPDSRKVLEFGQRPPALYANARIDSYRQVTGMTGVGVPLRGAAVVFKRDDLQSAVHHAGARWLARHGFKVEPAGEK